MYTQRSILSIYLDLVWMICPGSGSGSWLQLKIIQNLIILFIRYPAPASLPGLLSKIKIKSEYKIVDKRVRRMMTDQMNLILVFDRFEKPVYDAEHKMCFCCLEI